MSTVYESFFSTVCCYLVSGMNTEIIVTCPLFGRALFSSNMHRMKMFLIKVTNLYEVHISYNNVSNDKEIFDKTYYA
jgi:hypothetical protein